MSIAEDEACAYVNDAPKTVGFLKEPNAYVAGRTAPPTEAEIEACIRYLRDSAGNFGMMRLTRHQFRKLAKGILNTARRTVTDD